MNSVQSVIVLSDVHLGIPESYLHAKNESYAANCKAFLKLLKKLGPGDELILNGDFLDLVLGGHDEIYNDAREFFKLLSQAGPYKRIVYLPGNHDHHFWTSLVELMNINGSLRKQESPPGKLFYPYCFVDARFSSEDPDLVYDIPLVNLWPEDTACPEIVVKYPHHMIIIPDKQGEETNYLFTHGHFLESLFKPVNFLINPAHLEELEAFNTFWLEAFNYHIGHAGKLTRNVFQILESYEKGGEHETLKLKSILDSGYLLFSNLFRLKWHKALILKVIMKMLARRISFEGKGKLVSTPVNDDLKYNIAHYIRKYILLRYRKDEGGAHKFPMENEIPLPFTFVFGHTHRPVKQHNMKDTKVFIDGYDYPILNTGGWLKKTGDRELHGEWTGILIIDSNGPRWETLEGQLS